MKAWGCLRLNTLFLSSGKITPSIFMILAKVVEKTIELYPMLVVRRKGKKVEQPRQNAKKTQRRNGGSTGAVFLHPKMEPSYEVTYRKKIRWITLNNLAQANYTWSNLIDMIGVAVTATSGYNLFRMVRLHSVEVFDIGATQGAVSSCAVAFNENDTNQGGSGTFFSDMSFGVVPGHVKAIPPQDSLTSKWHVGFGPNTVNAFQLTCSSGSVIDIDVEYKGSTTAQVNGEALALVGAVVGATFWRGLDGLAVATSKFTNPMVYQL